MKLPFLAGKKPWPKERASERENRLEHKTANNEKSSAEKSDTAESIHLPGPVAAAAAAAARSIKLTPLVLLWEAAKARACVCVYARAHAT